ncbi:MAG: DUF5996 family protein [Gammaproteobacteria bacterium]|nr:DUF5996 family protein [Gammaproteobacteria bacterium]
MAQNGFLPLALADWRATRDTLHRYTRVLGAVRAALTPKQKHWWHISLRVAPDGLTTTEIPAGKSRFTLRLDLTAHRLVIQTGHTQPAHIPLGGQSSAKLSAQIMTVLEHLGIKPDIDKAKVGDATPAHYDRVAVERFWRALQRIDATVNRFHEKLGANTSPVQLWPHHFDLAMNWFSGRKVPGADPADEEAFEEQMNFGFSTGDDSIPDPYFYITAYPLPAELVKTLLPPDASWHTQGWTGAILPYASLTTAERPEEKLLGFLQQVHEAGSRLMK